MQGKVRRPACERDRRRRSLTYAVVSTLGTSKNDQTDLTYLVECARSVSGEHCRDQYEDGRLARRCTSGFGRTHPSSRTRCVRGTKGRVETGRRGRSGGTEAVGATEPATSVGFNSMRLRGKHSWQSVLDNVRRLRTAGSVYGDNHLQWLGTQLKMMVRLPSHTQGCSQVLS